MASRSWDGADLRLVDVVGVGVLEHPALGRGAAVIAYSVVLCLFLDVGVGHGGEMYGWMDGWLCWSFGSE